MADAILLESGDTVLLESGDRLLLEGTPIPTRNVTWAVRFGPEKWSCQLSAKWALELQAVTDRWDTAAPVGKWSTRAPAEKWTTGAPRR